MLDMEDIPEVLERDFILEPKAFGPGRRNDDTVDFMILCWCTDVEYRPLLGKIAETQGWSPQQKLAVEEVVDRVEPYLEDWGDRGTMEAMAYSINY